jgi:cytochrome c biogenesis factor
MDNFKKQKKNKKNNIYLITGLLFCGLLVVCFIGLLRPLILSWLINQPLLTTPGQYKAWTAPLFAMLIALMGLSPLAVSEGKVGRFWWLAPLVGTAVSTVMAICGERRFVVWFGFWLAGTTMSAMVMQMFPLAATWGDDSILKGGKAYRWSMWGIHAGAALLTLGVVGVELLQTRTIEILKEGMRFQFQDFQIQFNGVKIEDQPDVRESTTAIFELFHNGEETTFLSPRIDFYKEAQSELTVPAVSSTLAGDVMLLMKSWDAENGVEVEMVQSPLMVWVWIGGMIMGCAGSAALFLKKINHKS